MIRSNCAMRSLLIMFESFTNEFFQIFASENFYEGKTYLEYVANPQTNDEDNIVDTKIILPLLTVLGFESGEITKNQTGGTKDSSRPDFQVKLAGNVRCFLVEDKHTAFNLSNPEPLRQLASYAAMRGYALGLVCNGRSLLGWDLSNPSAPNPVLHLDIEQTVQTFYGQNLLAGGKTGIEALTLEQVQALKGLFRRFIRDRFAGIENLVRDICKPEAEWLEATISKQKTDNFDELLIEDLKQAIGKLEEDVLYQLDLLLKEYEEYADAHYLPNGNGKSEQENTAPKILARLRKNILNHLRVSGLMEVDDYSWADEKLLDFVENPKDSMQQLAAKFLERIKQSELRRGNGKTESIQVPQGSQLDLLSPISEVKQKELGIKIPTQKKITKLHPQVNRLLDLYQELVFSWQAWQAEQKLKHDRAIKAHQFFNTWKGLITKTVFQEADELKLKTEFARQTAYVYVIRLLMVRICEDKGLLKRKFSDGGFKMWKEQIEPQYLDFATGMSMDYLLEISYRSAQSVYMHFFDSKDLFNWYRIGANLLVEVLHILNRFNLAEIDSDIIGMVYGRYVMEGKHEQGRYFTPRKVVEYMLDGIGYRSDNPEIRDKTLLDLAGGSGSFLVHACRRLIDSYRSPSTGKVPISYVPMVIQKIKNQLFSFDINPFACYLAETNLLIQVIDLLKQAKEADLMSECAIDRFNVYNTDSLLLPEKDAIRVSFQNPMFDLELETISQIKTRRDRFSEGFDFIVGNPPYVKADEPGQLKYRQKIVEQGRFQTLYRKWDLFIPFIELARILLKDESSQLALIVSDAYTVATYGMMSREMLCEQMTVKQIDFFENLKLFEDAAVFNIIFIADNKLPKEESLVNRFWHNSLQDLYSFETTDSVNQVQFDTRIFRHHEVELDTSNTVLIDNIVYISTGMVLNSHEDKYPNEFVKDDLISDIQDQSHPVPYIEGKDIADYQINRIRYLEFGDGLRAPSRARRATFPELYIHKHIAIGKTGGITIVDGNIYSNDSVRVLLSWHLLDKVDNRSVPKDRVKENKKLSKKFSLQYLVAVLSSNLIQEFFNSISTGTRQDIMPDDLRKIPIKNITLKKQQPFTERVDTLIAGNWEMYELRQQGHRIIFDYNGAEPKVEINFLLTLQQLKLTNWSFLDSEPQRFEIIGDRNSLVTKIRIKDDTLYFGKEAFLKSVSPLVLEYLMHYLPQFADKARTWTSLLSEGKIPKTDASITYIFEECDRLRNEILNKIVQIRQTYQELDRMVNNLYGVKSSFTAIAEV